ncbi:MAG: BatA domain-containing protein [Candidatus Kapabacteria bacterium]|nr:BatA domain-containing protein [Candidatus Kapabacteria bacterium]
MQFLNPVFLFGLFAASIPLILHLLNLRKLKTIEFSTLSFLKELQKTKIRRLKIKQIILLILRTLIILFTVLAFARPAIKGTIPGFVSYAKTSTAIILDNSLSMDVSDAYGNRFNQAKNNVHAILASLKEADEAAIIPASGLDITNKYEMTRNFTLLKEELSQIKISAGRANLEHALLLATNLMNKSNNLNKEIYIISDCQRNNFDSQFKDSLKILTKGISLYILPVGNKSNSDIHNNSLDSIELVTQIFETNKPIDINFHVSNSSNKDSKGIVSTLLFNKNRVAQRAIDIPASNSRSFPVTAIPTSAGVYKAEIDLENDALELDNHRYFGFIIPEKPKVLVFGQESKLDYLIAAIRYKISDSYCNVDLAPPANISTSNLNNYELVILATGPYTKADFTKIAQYIKTGGSALIFADETTNAEVFILAMKDLGLDDIKNLYFSDKSPASFSELDKVNRIFEGVFRGSTEKKEIAESPKIIRAMPTSSGQHLIDIPGGAFLTELTYGDGKILYCAVPPTLTWSSLPLTGIFPTLIYRAIIILSAKDNLGFVAEVNQPFTLKLPRVFAAGGNFKIIEPDGIESYKQAIKMPSGAIIPFEPFIKPGVYIVVNSAGKAVTTISVNIPNSESKLIFMSKSELIERFKLRSDKGLNIEYIEDAQSISKSINRARTGTELWQFLLILTLIAAIAEMFVSRSGKAETYDK